VRQWAAADGALLSEFADVSAHELSALAVDGSHRRLFVGDADGTIRALNYATGVQARALRRGRRRLLCVLGGWPAQPHGRTALIWRGGSV
jgi:hypothetical protein